MIGDLNAYSEYKDSGVAWLGRVPTHWEARRVSSVARILNGATPSSATRSYWGGRVPWITPTDLGTLEGSRIHESARTLTKAGYEACGASMAPVGSLALSTRAPIGHIGILGLSCCSNQGCRLLVPNDSIQSDFFYCALATFREEIRALGQGSTFTELSREHLAAFRIGLPPLVEQVAIVRFLKYADRRIGRYIRAKERLIALLEEQKKAVIHDAVTGQDDVRTGLPYSAYKDSGVEWLGQVPAHWARRRLKTILRPVDRRSPTGTETLLSLRRDHGVVVYADHFSRPPQGRSLIGFKRVALGQLVVNRLQANNGLVFCSGLDGLVSPDYSVFERKAPLEMKYLSYLLRTATYRAHFRREATGLGTGSAGFLRLYNDSFLATTVYLPPVDEQGQVLRWLAAASLRLEGLIERERQQLRLVADLRSCLIADVVTGKVDVRQSTAALPEVDPLPAGPAFRARVDANARSTAGPPGGDPSMAGV